MYIILEKRIYVGFENSQYDMFFPKLKHFLEKIINFDSSVYHQKWIFNKCFRTKGSCTRWKTGRGINYLFELSGIAIL